MHRVPSQYWACSRESRACLGLRRPSIPRDPGRAWDCGDPAPARDPEQASQNFRTIVAARLTNCCQFVSMVEKVPPRIPLWFLLVLHHCKCESESHSQGVKYADAQHKGSTSLFPSLSSDCGYADTKFPCERSSMAAPCHSDRDCTRQLSFLSPQPHVRKRMTGMLVL